MKTRVRSAPQPRNRRPWRRVAWCLAHIFGIFPMAPVLADVDRPSVLVSGFGTLGYLDTSDRDIVFLRDNSQNGEQARGSGLRRDTRLGLQVNVDFAPHLGMVLQGVAREKIDATLGNSIEWAFARYSPTPDSDIRLGRIGLDLFMLSDGRNVGYTYHWVRPPVEFYGWLPLYYFDGGDFTYRWNSGDAHWQAKLFAGRATADTSLTGLDYHLKLSPGMGATLSWESGPWRLRGSYTYARFASEAPAQALTSALRAVPSFVWPQAAGLASEFELLGTSVTYSTAGFSYSDGSWHVLGELSYTTTEKLLVTRGTRAYLSVGRRVGDFLPFVSYAMSRDPRNPTVAPPPPGIGLEPLRDVAIAALSNQIRQSTWSAGVRWDVAAKTALKFQIDTIRIPGDGYGLWSPLWDLTQPPAWHGGRRTQFSVALDFVF